MKHNTLSPRDLREVRSELEREQRRYAEHDDRRERYTRALERLADGQYGICAGCGRAIPPDRLLAIPETSRCVGCSSRGASAPRFRQLATVHGD
jgi:RNA polymerase-binding transcription factor DksA